jgi:hypothetical protein
MTLETAWELIQLGPLEYGVRNISGASARYVSVSSNLDVAHHVTDGTVIDAGEIFSFTIDNQVEADEVWVCVTWIGPEGDVGDAEVQLTDAIPLIQRETHTVDIRVAS